MAKQKTLLIANRGEIACRIMRTAKKMGLKTLAVYSTADKNAMHIRHADEAICIGEGAPSQSYINIENVIEAAKKGGANLVHPGYGFLSENTDFAAQCAKNNIVFVGPPPSAITSMGRKDEAKDIAQKAGVPVVPGFAGKDQSLENLQKQADKIGYPLAIKAVAGGGGRGLRRVEKSADFASLLASAQREAQSGFGDAVVLLEKWIDKPRHIEVQILADNFGNTLYLGERDCTLQRRHQKVIEEAPAPNMSEQMRKLMGEAAVKAAKAVGYVGAGTVEFIVDGSKGLTPDGFYFMEMNTRLQVEHPVTEAITGLDLVEWQLRIALGEKLPITQDKVQLCGHAIEARLYAEDPADNFKPSLGKIVHLEWPAIDGVRIDAGYETNDTVSPYYDAMLAKIIVHEPTRERALEKLSHALNHTQLLGLKSNLSFLIELLKTKETQKATFETGFIDKNLESLTAQSKHMPKSALSSAMKAVLDHEQTQTLQGAWAQNTGFELAGKRTLNRRLKAQGQEYTLQIEWNNDQLYIDSELQKPESNSHATRICDSKIYVFANNQSWSFEKSLQRGHGQKETSSNQLISPLPGRLAIILKQHGESVEAGETIAVLEAMKMEHALKAPCAGTLGPWQATQGAQLVEGMILMNIEE